MDFEVDEEQKGSSIRVDHGRVAELRNACDSLHRRYQSLLDAVEQKPDCQRDNNEWKNTCETLVSIISTSIPGAFSDVQSDGERQKALVKVVSELCHHRSAPESQSESESYQVLVAKYERNRARMRQMKDKCAVLLGEVQRNRTIIERHIRAAHSKYPGTDVIDGAPISGLVARELAAKRPNRHDQTSDVDSLVLRSRVALASGHPHRDPLRRRQVTEIIENSRDCDSEDNRVRARYKSLHC